MQTNTQGRADFVVERSMSGQWNVLETGHEGPVATFQEKSDAVEYARRLACSKEDAQIRVLH